MHANFISETEMPGTKASRDQLQIICHRYYFASKFVSEKEVLEVGCGPGLGLGYLSRNAKRVVGGDITENSLKCAHEHYMGRDRIELVSMDAHKLPFRDGCFDVVVAVAAIIYLDLHSFFDECQRILKRGGILILNTPNKDIPGFRRSALSYKYYSAPELFALLGKYHFDAELFGAFPIPTGLPRQKFRALRSYMTVRVRKALELMPKGREIGDFLSNRIHHRTVLKEEIADDDMRILRILENVQLEPLPCNFPDFRHRILYVIAYAW